MRFIHMDTPFVKACLWFQWLMKNWIDSGIKKDTQRYKYSLMYQVFKNWQGYKRKLFNLTFKLNSKHTNYNCNLLNFTDELTLTKQQKTSMTKFQQKYNHTLCLIQAVFNTFKTVCWVEPQKV